MNTGGVEHDNPGTMKEDKTSKSLKRTSAENGEDDLEYPPTKQRMDGVEKMDDEPPKYR